MKSVPRAASRVAARLKALSETPQNRRYLRGRHDPSIGAPTQLRPAEVRNQAGRRRILLATTLQVQTPGDFSPAAEYSSPWLDRPVAPLEEAISLFALIGRNGDTVESVRELIAVPPRMETALILYAQRNPEDARGIERVLQFRRRVAEEFERLTRTWLRFRNVGLCVTDGDGYDQNQKDRCVGPEKVVTDVMAEIKN
jgi:hypothetical protein